MKPRLLLVEFLNDDPLHQHRIRRFPYFQGFARRNGFETRWVSIAAGREARPVHPWEVELPSDRLQLLVGAITDFGPTVLVTNERLGASTSAASPRRTAITSRHTSFPSGASAQPPGPS